MRAQVRTAHCETARALSFSGGSAVRALATCARPAALLQSAHIPWKPTAPAGRPSPRCMAVLRRVRRKLQTSSCLACVRKSELRKPRALSLSREEAQHARLRRARAAPCWLESAHTGWKPTAPAGRPSPLVHGRAPACEPQTPYEQPTFRRAQVKNAPTARALSMLVNVIKSLVRRACSKRSCCYSPATLPAVVPLLVRAANGAQPPLVCVNPSQKNRLFLRLTGHALQKHTPSGPPRAWQRRRKREMCKKANKGCDPNDTNKQLRGVIGIVPAPLEFPRWKPFADTGRRWIIAIA